MTRRKRGHRRDNPIAGFRKWVSGIAKSLKPRKRKLITEGTRFMTHAEERAAIAAITLPRQDEKVPELLVMEPIERSAVVKPLQVPQRDIVQELTPAEPVEKPYDSSIVLPDPASKIPPAQTTHRRHQVRKRKPKRWRHIFARRKKASPVLIDLALTSQLNTENVVKKKKSFRAYLKPAINSTSLFVLAYLIVWFTYQLGVMIQASFSDIDSVLYYYEVMFPIGNYSQLWSQFNIILITAAGPMLSVLMGIIYRYVFLGRTNPGNQMRLLLVWLYLLSMAFFFGAFVAGIITNQGFGYVAGWLYMNIVFRIGISLIFLFILAFLGWKSVRFLPEVSGSDSFKRNHKAFVISRLSIPWLTGSVLMLLLKHTSFVPQHANIYEYDMIIIGSMLFPVAAAIFNKRERPHLYKNPHRSTSTKTIVIWAIAAILVALLVRFGLARGLYLQLKILLDIGMYR